MTFLAGVRAGVLARPAIVGAAGEDALATAWFAKHTTPPSADFRASTSKMFARLRSEGHLPFFTRLMLGTSETLQGSLVDVIQPEKGGTIVGAVAHKPKVGWQGDRATGLIDLGENCASPALGGGGQNNLLVGGFVVEPSASFTVSAFQGVIGQPNASYRIGLLASRDRLSGRTGDTASPAIERTGSPTSHVGHFTMCRANNAEKFYFDNAGNKTVSAAASTGISTTNYQLLSVAASNFSDFTLALGYAGLATANGETFDTPRRTLLDVCFRDYLKEIGAIPAA